SKGCLEFTEIENCRVNTFGRGRLREGVLRDLERQSRKQENIRLLEDQIILTKHLEAERDRQAVDRGPQQS
ncbi:protein PET117 homolog, mitochondrial, partial [Alligator sinensis]|uniref:Protein PET117 homolog, mitochondrial n=1 Tax=Alligator sinensis TaxID=38654 RepID=A0A3Q0H782_ALLSI